MIAAVAAVALFGFSPGLPDWLRGQPDRVVERAQVGPWRLEVAHDGFTGKTLCVVRNGDMTYHHGVMTFDFGGGTDTAEAQFRLDDGPPVKTVILASQAAGLGARFGSNDLRNPSGGVVHIPASALGQAQQISIRPGERADHRVFSLGGLPEALDAARAKGCDVV